MQKNKYIFIWKFEKKCVNLKRIFEGLHTLFRCAKIENFLHLRSFRRPLLLVII